MILPDTSGLLAAIDADQRLHVESARSLQTADPPLILSPFVLAELDYLLTTRLGRKAELALLGEVGRGAYEVVGFSNDDVRAAAAVIDRRRDLDLGLADASLVVLAARFASNELLTLDERHWDEALTAIDMVTLLDPESQAVHEAAEAAAPVLATLGATVMLHRLQAALTPPGRVPTSIPAASLAGRRVAPR